MLQGTGFATKCRGHSTKLASPRTRFPAGDAGCTMQISAVPSSREAAAIRCGKHPDSIHMSTSSTGETKTQCTKGLKLNKSCAMPPSSRPSRPRCCLSTQGDSQLARQRDAGFCFKASDSGFTKNICSGAGRAPASPAGFASGRWVNHAGGGES